MLFRYFTLLVALVIETVGAYYSITGLAAIFSGAVVPILIMGASLEVGKVTAAVWLKMYWERASITYKLYLVPAVAFLMLLTSMGIFGFLSKAHSDQSLVSGDSMAKVAIYDEKINTAKDNIATNRKALKQMDEAVDQVMARSDDEKGADKAVAVRRSQQKERTRLLAEIEVEQKKISALSEERAPLAAEFRKVESEVGPIKYIAALIYGDNPDANILERAVRWVIILIVAVFDPLALVLILAAQQTLRWAREDQERKPAVEPAATEKHQIPDVEEPEPETRRVFGWPIPGNLNFPFPKQDEVKSQPLVVENSDPEDNVPVVEPPGETVYVDPPNWGTAPNTDLDVYNDQRLVSNVDKQILAAGIDAERPGDYVNPPEEDEKAAIRAWKTEHPDDTIKRQRQLYDEGKIDRLPWEDAATALGLEADNEPPVGTMRGFGTQWPDEPVKGDMFLRVDRLPSALYKYNGKNWIEIDKNLSDQYSYDTAYIDHLINKIDSGEYDPDLLTEAEVEQIAQRFQTRES